MAIRAKRRARAQRAKRWEPANTQQKPESTNQESPAKAQTEKEESADKARETAGESGETEGNTKHPYKFLSFNRLKGFTSQDSNVDQAVTANLLSREVAFVDPAPNHFRGDPHQFGEAVSRHERHGRNNGDRSQKLLRFH